VEERRRGGEGKGDEGGKHTTLSEGGGKGERNEKAVKR